MSIYAWRRKYQKYGMIGLMAKKNSIPRQPLSQIDAPLQSDELEALRTQIRELQLEVDVLKETIEVLKKDPDADLAGLKNREKAVIIGALGKSMHCRRYWHISIWPGAAIIIRKPL